MNTIPSANDGNPYGALGLGVTAPQRSTSLGQADFLRLMTEQLKNQDPLKPLENNEFLGQLAQFSTVQGIDSMQTAMSAMASVMESDQTLRAASLVGRSALVEASSVQLGAGAGLSGEVTAPNAGPVRIEIVDASGAVVSKVEMNAAAAGTLNWEWDGKDTAGNAVPAGTYTIRASSGAGSNSAALEVRLATRIDSVSIEPTGLVLNLQGLGSHPLSSIRRIS